MEREEAKRVVEMELLKLDMGCVFAMTDRGDHIHYENEEAEFEVSIQERRWSDDEEVNVYVDFKKDDLGYELTSHGATYDTISKLFAEYKRIKGE